MALATSSQWPSGAGIGRTPAGATVGRGVHAHSQADSLAEMPAPGGSIFSTGLSTKCLKIRESSRSFVFGLITNNGRRPVQNALRRRAIKGLHENNACISPDFSFPPNLAHATMACNGSPRRQPPNSSRLPAANAKTASLANHPPTVLHSRGGLCHCAMGRSAPSAYLRQRSERLHPVRANAHMASCILRLDIMERRQRRVSVTSARVDCRKRRSTHAYMAGRMLPALRNDRPSPRHESHDSILSHVPSESLAPAR